jgi:hypothetical protein
MTDSAKDQQLRVQRSQVEAMAGFGMLEADIATVAPRRAAAGMRRFSEMAAPLIFCGASKRLPCWSFASSPGTSQTNLRQLHN